MSKCIIVECYALMSAAAAAVSVFCVCARACVCVCNRHPSRVVTENGVLTDARPWWQGPGGSRRRGETHTHSNTAAHHTTTHAHTPHVARAASNAIETKSKVNAVSRADRFRTIKMRLRGRRRAEEQRPGVRLAALVVLAVLVRRVWRRRSTLAFVGSLAQRRQRWDNRSCRSTRR